MIYRKTPPQPIRLLLRVVAGATAAMAVACSSSSSGGGTPGIVDSGGDATGPCGDGVCGTVANPEAGCEVNGICDAAVGVVDSSPCSIGSCVDANLFDGPVGVAPLDSGTGDGGADQ